MIRDALARQRAEIVSSPAWPLSDSLLKGCPCGAACHHAGNPARALLQLQLAMLRSCVSIFAVSSSSSMVSASRSHHACPRAGQERDAALASTEGRVAQLAATYRQLFAEQAAQSAARVAELQQELAQAQAAQMAAEVIAMQQATMLAVFKDLQCCHH